MPLPLSSTGSRAQCAVRSRWCPAEPRAGSVTIIPGVSGVPVHRLQESTSTTTAAGIPRPAAGSRGSRPAGTSGTASRATQSTTYGNFDIYSNHVFFHNFLMVQSFFLSVVPPHPRREMCSSSTWCPCLLDFDCCLHSDVLSDSRCPIHAVFRPTRSRITASTRSTATYAHFDIVL